MSKKEKRVFDLMDQLEEYIEESKAIPLVSNRVMVEKEVLEGLLDDLREILPKELEEARRIISTKESILQDAQKQAEFVMEKAIKEAESTVDQNEIVKLAERRAYDIEKEAREKAQEMELAARKYAQESKRKADELAKSINMGAYKYTENMLNAMEEHLMLLKKNQDDIFSKISAGLSQDIQDVQINRSEIRMELKKLENQ